MLRLFYEIMHVLRGGSERSAMCVGGMALHPGVWAGRRRLQLKCETPGDGLQQACFGGVEESRRIYQSAHSVIIADAYVAPPYSYYHPTIGQGRVVIVFVAEEELRIMRKRRKDDTTK